MMGKSYCCEVTKRGWALLAISLVLAFVCQFAHGSFLSRYYVGLPGIGVTISLYLIVGTALWAARGEGALQLKKNPGGVLLLACCLLLGACFGIYGNPFMRMMNGLVLIVVTIATLFSLCGHHGEGALSAAGWRRAIFRSFPLFFRYVLLPFRCLREAFWDIRGNFRGLGLGLLIAIPVLAAAVALLSSADAMFASLFSGGFGLLNGFNGGTVFRIFLALLLGLMLFSFLQGTVYEKAPESWPSQRQAPAMTFSLVLWGMALLYGIFAFLQFRYLFAGAEAVQMQGGYAQYARSGFFQLVLLACITLAVLLCALCLCKESKMIRMAGGAVAALTIIIDISACFRMMLYIRAYGLTLLRVVTLWGMGAILAALLLAIVKCIRTDFKMVPLLSGVVLITWIGLNYLNVDVQIARYNVSAWEKGQLGRLDAKYLGSLSPDVLPVLEKLEDDEARARAVGEAMETLRYQQPLAYDWSLSWRHMPAEEGNMNRTENHMDIR